MTTDLASPPRSGGAVGVADQRQDAAQPGGGKQSGLTAPPTFARCELGS